MGCFQNEALVAHVLGFGGLVQYGKECGTFVQFLWIKGVFYHGMCVIIYAGRIVPCLHWYLIRVIGLFGLCNGLVLSGHFVHASVCYLNVSRKKIVMINS